MASHGMFLAMVLANAKRQEARSVVLTVEALKPRIDLLLLDGSTQALAAPPAEVLLQILVSLEEGQRQFSSSVYAAHIEKVAVQRGADSVAAHISDWSIAHTE